MTGSRIDDHALLTMIQHVPYGALSAEKLSRDVDVIKEVETFGRHLQKICGLADTGIIQQDIQPTKEFDAPVYQVKAGPASPKSAWNAAARRPMA